jgi:uncharacterized phage protein gp47/JayE
MSYTVPTLDEIHDDLLASFKSRLDQHDVSKWSDNWKRLRVIAFGLWGLYNAGKITYDDLFPDTASEAGLEHWGRMLDVPRRGATVVRKSDALRVVGTLGATASAGEQLTHENGLTYELNENVTVPAALYFDADVISVDTGSATHLEAGQILTFSSPPAGITAEAELQLDLDEDGEDQESIGAWRTRILDKLGEPGLGGNQNDYATWALEVTGISTAYVYPLRAGRGSVDVAALHTGSGSVRALNATERTALQDAIDLERPCHVKSFRVLETTTQAENIEMKITPRPGAAYVRDWDDSTPPVVSSWVAGTKTLTFTAARPSDMAAGDRLVIKTNAGNGTGQQYTISELGAGANDVVLEEVPVPAPVNPDTVYSGGPLIDDVRDALIAHMDALGPAVGSYGTGEWDSDLNPSRLEAVALAIENVRDAVCDDPASTVVPDDPVYPNDDSIEFLIPQETLVRYE